MTRKSWQITQESNNRRFGFLAILILRKVNLWRPMFMSKTVLKHKKELRGFFVCKLGKVKVVKLSPRAYNTCILKKICPEYPIPPRPFMQGQGVFGPKFSYVQGVEGYNFYPLRPGECGIAQIIPRVLGNPGFEKSLAALLTCKLPTSCFCHEPCNLVEGAVMKCAINLLKRSFCNFLWKVLTRVGSNEA